jgi:hypothetical protein
LPVFNGFMFGQFTVEVFTLIQLNKIAWIIFFVTQRSCSCQPSLISWWQKIFDLINIESLKLKKNHSWPSLSLVRKLRPIQIHKYNSRSQSYDFWIHNYNATPAL